MIYDNLEFHNVEELEMSKGINGLLMCRFPSSVTANLGIEKNYRGRFMSKRVQGCEIRFVSDAPFFEIGLTSLIEDTEVLIYKGDYFHSATIIRVGELSCISVENPDIFNNVNLDKLERRRFSCNVWRIVFGRNGSVAFNYLDTFGFSKRPPSVEEKPEKKWVAYGSSITCGCVSTTYTNAYANRTAINLGYDLCNKGMSGSSMCEEAVAEYLADTKCDLMTLELGVNLVPYCSRSDFFERIYRFLDIIATSKAEKIFVFDMFPNKGKICTKKISGYFENYEAFKSIVKELVENRFDGRFIFINGDEVLPNLSYLSTDLLHPGNDGHVLMSGNLTKILMDKNV